MKSINRATINDWLSFTLHTSSENYHKCVFISHKKEDEPIAIELGNYILNNLDCDIYLDTDDCVLQEAVSKENDRKIVESIHRGLLCSTHLICIISDKTRLSWWVPYEIGFAEHQNEIFPKYKTGSQIEIASIKVKTIDEIPSFLKIKKTLSSTAELADFLKSAAPFGDSLVKNYTSNGYDGLEKWKSILDKYGNFCKNNKQEKRKT